MRKPRRDIEIFNMSLLDILCGALGAFCFLTLTLFPFYGRVEGAAFEEQKKLRAEAEAIEKQIAEVESAANDPAQLTEVTVRAQREAARLAEEVEALNAKKVELQNARREISKLRVSSGGPSDKDKDDLKKELDDLRRKAAKRRKGKTRNIFVIVRLQPLTNADFDFRLQPDGAFRTNPSISGKNGATVWASIAEPSAGNYQLVMDARQIAAPVFEFDLCTHIGCVSSGSYTFPIQSGQSKTVLRFRLDPFGDFDLVESRP